MTASRETLIATGFAAILMVLIILIGRRARRKKRTASLWLVLLVLGFVGYFAFRYYTRQQTLAPFKPYVESYLAMTGLARGEAPYVRGKLVGVDMRDKRIDYLFQSDLPSELRALTPEEVGTIAQYVCTSSVAMSSSAGNDTVAYRCELTLVDTAGPALIESRVFEKTSGEEGYTDALYPEIIAYIASLPRKP